MKRGPAEHHNLMAKLDSVVDDFKSQAQRQTKPAQGGPAVMTDKMDGWSNVLTGIGRALQDKRMANVATWDAVLPEMVAEDVYAGDPTARRIIELLPNEATREWIEFEDEKVEEDIEDEIKRLHMKERFYDAWVYARLYGGGGVFINTGESVERLKMPLDLDNVKQVKSFVPLTRWELWVWATDVQRDISSPDFGKPKYYRMYPRLAFGNTAVQVHASRIIRFDGRRLPRIKNIQNNFWGDSVLTPLYEILGDFKTSHAAVANMVQSYSILVAKLKGLAQILASPGGDAKVSQRISLMTQMRSMFGMAVIDAEDETEFHSPRLAGLSELMDQVKGRLQAETDIPHTILFNESPSGLGATGNSEEKSWYNYVASQQKNYFKPRLDQGLKLIFAQKNGPFKGKEPENWEYEFKPLWQMDDLEQAKIEQLQSQTDGTYFDLGVRTTQQIIEKRFPEDAANAEVLPNPPGPVAGPGGGQPALPGAPKPGQPPVPPAGPASGALPGPAGPKAPGKA